MDGEGRNAWDPQAWRPTACGRGKEKDFSVAAAALDHSFPMPHSIKMGWSSPRPPLCFSLECDREILWGRRAAFGRDFFFFFATSHSSLPEDFELGPHGCWGSRLR